MKQNTNPTNNNSDSRKVIFRSDNHQIVSLWAGRRFLVQRFNTASGSTSARSRLFHSNWKTEKVCDNDADARAFFSKATGTPIDQIVCEY